VSPTRLTKTQRRRARQLAEAGWQAELSEALRDLQGLFGDWRRGHLDAFQLSDAIHEFHDGPNRDLFKRYTRLPPEMAAARAVALDLVDPAEVPDDLREALGGLIDFWREEVGRVGEDG